MKELKRKKKMKYLNLTKGFNPYNANEEDCIKFESFFFNGGEPHIKLSRDSFHKGGYSDVIVTSRLTSMNEFMMLVVASEALSQCGVADKRFLFIPYFPGSRQDRRMVFGEPLTVKVMANIINDLDYDNVATFDNHSEVSTALVDNGEDINNHAFVSECINRIMEINEANFHIISPDAGSNKKIGKLLSSGLFNFSPDVLVKCDKTRNTQTGVITGFEVYKDSLQNHNAIIVDDLCDGGGTFIGLSKELKAKGADKIYLIVSHGIFSKPLKELKPYIDKIYTTDSWRSAFDPEQVERDSTDLVEIVEFKDFI